MEYLFDEKSYFLGQVGQSRKNEKGQNYTDNAGFNWTKNTQTYRGAHKKEGRGTHLLTQSRKGSNKYMKEARSGKNDEFYTILSDVENELKHYKKHFRNKTVFCNCDDPYISSFFHYFSCNFDKLKLKKLITSCYKNQQTKLFSQNKSKRGIYIEYDGTKSKNHIPKPTEIGVHKLKKDGDFRSEECVEILKRSDVVVTNPPFSLFRDYVKQLVEYKKKFLIIGTWNAITYKEIFPLIKTNKMWMGINSNRNFAGFIVPKHYKLFGTESFTDEKGNRIVKTNQNCWFTNLDVAKRHEDLILYKKYKTADYPKYDNYNAIEVSKTKNIPMGYKGIMGVPITFMDKYNPNQFEILGDSRYHDGSDTANDINFINGSLKFRRILIRHKKSKRRKV